MLVANEERCGERGSGPGRRARVMLADLDVNDGPGAVGAVPPGERIVQGRRRDGEKQFMRTHAMYQSL